MATRPMCASVLRGLFGIKPLRCDTIYSLRSIQRCIGTAAESKSTDEVKNSGTETGELSDECQKKIADLESLLAEETEKNKKHLKEVEDKYKRSLAETENVRQRMKKQVDDAKLFGIQGFCKDLLEVADVLNKATESVPADQLTANNPHLVGLHEGLSMTNTQLIKVFTRHGLVQINPDEGERFDPYFHEALFQQAVPGKEGGTVAVVTKVGYKLHDRTIRPALVGVFK